MEIVLIVAVALLFFGPSRLPGLGKSVGEAIRGFKKAMDGRDEIVVDPDESKSDPRESLKGSDEKPEPTPSQHRVKSTHTEE